MQERTFETILSHLQVVISELELLGRGSALRAPPLHVATYDFAAGAAGTHFAYDFCT